MLAKAGTDDALRAAADRVTDAKAIIRAFSTLAFPLSSQRDEQFRLLLFGDEAVLDRGLVATELTASRWRQDVDPLTVLASWHASHDAELDRVVDGWQRLLAARRHSETHQLIEVTLEDLRIAKRVADPLAISADGTRAGATLLAGGSMATGTTASAGDPVAARVTMPRRGAVLITERPGPGPVAREVDVKAPAGSAEEPLLLEFRVDATRAPGGDALGLRRNGATVADCNRPDLTSPDPCVATRDLLSDGDVRLTVRSSRASVWSFAAPGGSDTEPPETTIVSAPSGSTTSHEATVAFSASESGSTFGCSLDGGEFSSCTSPKALTALGAGAHELRVRATDAAGNTDPTPASASWTVTEPTTNPPEVTPPPPAPVKLCIVPRMKGKTLAQSRRLLARANCALGRRTEANHAKVRKGRVLRQSVRAGRRMPAGTRIGLTLSRGRK